MKKVNLILTLFSLMILLSCSKEADVENDATTSISKGDYIADKVIGSTNYIKAADVSFVPQIESKRIALYGSYTNANGIVSYPKEDMLTTLQSKGCNTVRIRVWVNPVDNRSSLNEVIALANRAHQLNMYVWLSIHYSDTWADVNFQPVPAAWKTLNYNQLVAKVVAYTKDVVTRVKPEYVQMGNETNKGLLCDNTGTTGGTGIRNGANATDPFIDMMKNISTAITEVRPSCKKIIHYAGFGANAEAYFQYIKNNNIIYDYAAVSYYPTSYSGANRDIDALFRSLQNIKTVSGKSTLIAETAYPYTLDNTDSRPNVTTLQSQLLSYNATPQGQKAFLVALKTKIRDNGYCDGFAYWGGDFVRGVDLTDIFKGSNYDNMSFYNNNPAKSNQPILDAYAN